MMWYIEGSYLIKKRIDDMQFPFTVDRELTFDQRLANCGCLYDESCITEANTEESVGVVGAGTYDLVAELFPFQPDPKMIISEEKDSMEDWIVNNENFRIPNIIECLAFAETHGDSLLLQSGRFQSIPKIVLFGFVISSGEYSSIVFLGNSKHKSIMYPMFIKQPFLSESCEYRLLVIRKNDCLMA